MPHGEALDMGEDADIMVTAGLWVHGEPIDMQDADTSSKFKGGHMAPLSC